LDFHLDGDQGGKKKEKKKKRESKLYKQTMELGNGEVISSN
jgi:hypothetical protein